MTKMTFSNSDTSKKEHFPDYPVINFYFGLCSYESITKVNSLDCEVRSIRVYLRELFSVVETKNPFFNASYNNNTKINKVSRSCTWIAEILTNPKRFSEMD